MPKTVDLLDSANQKFDPGGSGMTSNNAQDAILEAFNDVEVAKDTTPALGGDLDLDGHNILITNPSDELEGAIGLALNNTDVFFARIEPGGTYNPADGGILCKSGALELGGSVVEIPALKGTKVRDLRITEDGIIFAAELPDPGWEVSDTSTFDHNFGNGKTQGSWVEVQGLEVLFGGAVSIGDRVDIFVNLYVENTEDKAGTIEIGVGINGANPTVVGASKSVGPEALTYVPVSWVFISGANYTTGDRIDVFARRGVSQDDAHLYLRGTTSEHGMIVSVPAA